MNKFYKILLFIIVIVSVLTITCISCFAAHVEGSYSSGIESTYDPNDIINSNSLPSTPSTDNPYNASGLAPTTSVSWNLWELYRNEVVFSFYQNNYDYLEKTAYTENNLVSRASNGVVTICNTKDSPIQSPGVYFDTIKTVALSVPTTKLNPQFYVAKNYLNQELIFMVNVTISLTEETANGGKFNFFNGEDFTPRFRIYEGTNNLAYSVIHCDTTRTYIRSMTDTIISIDFYNTVAFDHPCFISGFWCGVSFDDRLFFKGNESEDIKPRFIVSYTLSPMYFIGSLDLNFFYETEKEFLDNVYNNFLSPFMSNGQFPTLQDSLGVGSVMYGMEVISNLLNYWYNNFVIFKVLVNLSISLGTIMVVLGIAPTIYNIIKKNT